MEQNPVINPYHSSGPVGSAELFFGRERLFEWLQANIAGGPSGMLVITGPPGIGKSSIINGLQRGRLGDSIVTLAVDVASLPVSSLTDFLWTLSKRLVQAPGLPGSGIKAPEKRLFVLRPRQTFRESLLEPLLEELEPRTLLFAFDDLHVLANSNNKGDVEREIRAFLDGLLTISQRLVFVGVVNEAKGPDSEWDLAPLELSNEYRLGPLRADEVAQLVRLPAPYRTPSGMGQLIFDLTGGHPADVQQICHLLWERWRRTGFQQVTSADVMSVLSRDGEGLQFHTPVMSKKASLATNRL